MADYVLEQDTQQTSVARLSQIIGYAEFLKQPLELGMFVPCVDGDPFNYSKHGNKGQYIQADSKVLFKGFNIRRFTGSKDNHFDYVDNIDFQFRIYTKDVGSDIWEITDNKLKTIEDLVKYELELTN